MNLKTIDHQYKRKIAKGLVADMIDEILGLIKLMDMACDHKRSDILIAHERCFVQMVEQELDIYDKITMYSFAHAHCVDITFNRRYSRGLRAIIHKWGSDIERRIDYLNRKYSSSGVEGLRNAYKETIRLQYKNDEPNYVLVDRAILLLQDLEEGDE